MGAATCRALRTTRIASAGPAGSCCGRRRLGAGGTEAAELAQEVEPEPGAGRERDDRDREADEDEHELPGRAAVAAEDPSLVQPVAMNIRRRAVGDRCPSDRQ